MLVVCCLILQVFLNFTNFFNKKFKNCVYFFTYILPDYMAHDIPKEFKKNNLFEYMTAGFLLRCPKSEKKTFDLH